MAGFARNADLAALIALREVVDLKFIGCRVDRCLAGGISVTVGTDVVGAWWYEGGQYHFARQTKQRPSHSAANCAEVVGLTKSIAMRCVMVCKSRAQSA